MKAALQQGGSDSEDSSSNKSWNKLTKTDTEMAYIMGAAQVDQDMDDISVDSTTAKKYLKRYRKSTKRRKH